MSFWCDFFQVCGQRKTAKSYPSVVTPDKPPDVTPPLNHQAWDWNPQYPWLRTHGMWLTQGGSRISQPWSPTTPRYIIICVTWDCRRLAIRRVVIIYTAFTNNFKSKRKMTLEWGIIKYGSVGPSWTGSRSPLVAWSVLRIRARLSSSC